MSVTCSRRTHQELIRNPLPSLPDEFVHGGDDTWPGSCRFPHPRHPKARWQARYQDGKRERSAGIYSTPKAAETVRKRVDRGLPPTLEDLAADPVDATKAQALLGDYIASVWWPTWKAQHPDSAYCVGKRVEKWILPTFGNLPFARLDADRIGAWKADLVASGLKSITVNTYLSLLGTILNTAVDLAALRWEDVHLDHPLDDGAVSGPGLAVVQRPRSGQRWQ
jgi:hypothetical protein